MNIKLRRFMAFIIDVMIVALLAILVYEILAYFGVKVITPMIGIFAWAILFCKDCFNGTSIGKYITKIQVINADTGQIATPLKCVVRNLFYLLTIIELIVLFFNSKERRLGDYVTHTKITQYNKTLKGSKISQILLAIGYVLIGLIIFEVFFYFRASSLGLLGLLYEK